MKILQDAFYFYLTISCGVEITKRLIYFLSGCVYVHGVSVFVQSV